MRRRRIAKPIPAKPSKIRAQVPGSGIAPTRRLSISNALSGDRHQFRFIVAAEDGAEYQDLKPMIRRLMAQAEKDLGTKLDWVAVNHFNTGHSIARKNVRFQLLWPGSQRL